MKKTGTKPKRFVRRFMLAMMIIMISVPPVFGMEIVSSGPAAGGSSDENVVCEDEASVDIDDPEFNRYYEFDDEGNIVKKSDMDNMRRAGTYKHPSKYADCKVYDCIDVSAHQSTIDWEKVKAAGITHAIIRVAYRGQTTGSLNKDSRYVENIKGAYNAGIKVGVYIYSQAITEAEGREEAKYITDKIEAYRSMITMPVVFDYEFGLAKSDGGRFYAGRLSKSKMTAICTAFCEYIKDKDYDPMVYANYNMLSKYLDKDELSARYKIWLAHYNTSTDYPGEFYMWQYTSGGSVSGISGRVDMNFIYEKDTGAGKWVKTDSGKYMYLKSDGRYACSEWITHGGYRYYINSSKVRVTGYKKIGYYYYGFSSSGKMYKSTTVAIGTKKYRFASSGKSILYTAKTTDALNYRTGPGTGYKVKGTYAKGKVIYVVREKDGWGRTSGGYWVKLSYTKKITKYPQSIYPYKVKTTDALNYRTGPGTSYKIKGTYSKGKILTVVSAKNGWGKLKNGYWVKLSYTKKI